MNIIIGEIGQDLTETQLNVHKFYEQQRKCYEFCILSCRLRTRYVHHFFTIKTLKKLQKSVKIGQNYSQI